VCALPVPYKVNRTNVTYWCIFLKRTVPTA